jgi:hypothetical protein
VAVETVRIVVSNQFSPTPEPIEDVLVRVFDESGVFITQDYTSLQFGETVVDFSLEGDDPPVNYIVRLAKERVAFDGSLGDISKSPQIISVYSPPASSPTGTNEFSVKGVTFERPVAQSLNLCRVSGFFNRGDGKPYVDMSIQVEGLLDPGLVDGVAVMPINLCGKTDSDGYFQTDLYRKGIYSVTLETLDMKSFYIYVPDAPSANFCDLIFEHVTEVVFTPAVVALAVGDVVDVTVTVTTSSTRVLEGTGFDYVNYAATVGPEHVTVDKYSDKLTVTGMSPGSSEVTAERIISDCLVIPDTPLICSPLLIVVS